MRWMITLILLLTFVSAVSAANLLIVDVTFYKDGEQKIHNVSFGSGNPTMLFPTDEEIILKVLAQDGSLIKEYPIPVGFTQHGDTPQGTVENELDKVDMHLKLAYSGKPAFAVFNVKGKKSAEFTLPGTDCTDNCAFDVGSVEVPEEVEASCGDGVCSGSESLASCAQDCRKAEPARTGPVCGDDKCESGENFMNCPEDCSEKLEQDKRSGMRNFIILMIILVILGILGFFFYLKIKGQPPQGGQYQQPSQQQYQQYDQQQGQQDQQYTPQDNQQYQGDQYQ